MNNVLQTRFLWDGAELLAELNSSNQLLKSYVHGPEVDEVLYQEDYVKNETLFFHQDHLMSTVALTDSQGVIKESYTYDPYGKLMTAKDSFGNTLLPSTRILFTGREFDSETSLYFNRARYYDPSIGRFISADPIGYRDGLNLYAYARNNPLTFRDPQGLAASGCIGGCPVSNQVRDPYWGGKGGKKGKRGGFKGFLGVVLGVVAAVVLGPVIGAVAGAIGGAIGGAVGAVAGSAVGAAVTGVVAAGAAAAGAAVVATATSNLIQGASVFRGVGINAAIAAITAGAFKAVSVIGKGIQQWAARQFAPQVELSRASSEVASRSVNASTVETNLYRGNAIDVFGQTRFANESRRGQQILGAFRTASEEGRIFTGDLTNLGAFGAHRGGYIVLDLDAISQSRSVSTPGVLAHEGTHLVRYIQGAKTGFANEREAFNNGFRVDVELGYKGYLPSDDEIRRSYGFR